MEAESSSLRVFRAEQNSLSGVLPEKGLLQMSEVLTELNVGWNRKLSGTIPARSLASMVHMVKLDVAVNRFAGAFFAESGEINRMRHLEDIDVSKNRLSGSLSNSTTLTSLTRLSVIGNRFTGSLPELPLWHMAKLKSLYVSKNRLTGTLGADPLRKMRGLGRVLMAENFFAGPLPSSFWREPMYTLQLNGNRFEGPLCGDDVLPFSTRFYMLTAHENRLSGTLSSEGIRAVMNVHVVVLHANRFTGTLPEELLLKPFGGGVTVSDNAFVGTVAFPPQTADKVSYIFWAKNLFEGALPDHEPRHVAALEQVVASDNFFEGYIPASLGCVPVLGLTGIPSLRGVLPSCNGNRIGALSDTSSIYRMFSHGLEGVLPELAGTLAALTVFGNHLRGSMPSLLLRNDSKIIAHHNRLSCRLPHNQNVKLTFALTLLGNSFTAPPKEAFPAWVHESERSIFFCASDKPSIHWISHIVAGCGTLLPLFLARQAATHARSAASAPLGSRQSAAQRELQSMVHWSLQLTLAHGLAMLAFLLPFYMRAPGLMCMTVMSRLQLPRLHTLNRSSAPIASMMLIAIPIWLCLCRGIIRVHTQHAKRAAGPDAETAGDAVIQSGVCGVLARLAFNFRAMEAGVAALWVLVVAVLSGPGAVFSILQSVPGFLHHSPRIIWCLSHAISLATLASLTLCLPACAAALENLLARSGCTGISSMQLQSIGKLATAALLPALVSVVFHPECFSRWVQWWQPCSSGFDLEPHTTLDLKISKSHVVKVDIVNRADLCATSWVLSLQACAYHIIDRIGFMLLRTLSQVVIITPPCRLVLQRPMPRKDFLLLVAGLLHWELLFGSTMPILVVCVGASLALLTVVAFGDVKFLAKESSSDSTAPTSSASSGLRMPRQAMWLGVSAAILLQLALVLPEFRRVQ